MDHRHFLYGLITQTEIGTCLSRTKYENGHTESGSITVD